MVLIPRVLLSSGSRQYSPTSVRVAGCGITAQCLPTGLTRGVNIFITRRRDASGYRPTRAAVRGSVQLTAWMVKIAPGRRCS